MSMIGEDGEVLGNNPYIKRPYPVGGQNWIGVGSTGSALPRSPPGSGLVLYSIVC